MVRSWRNKGQVGKRNLVQADCCSLRFLFSSRSDIAYRVGLISRLMNHPRLSHLLAAKRILRYVKGFLDYGFSNHGKNVSGEIFGNYDSVMIKLTERVQQGMCFRCVEHLFHGVQRSWWWDCSHVRIR